MQGNFPSIYAKETPYSNTTSGHFDLFIMSLPTRGHFELFNMSLTTRGHFESFNMSLTTRGRFECTLQLCN